ncbi:MAG: tyrosine/phenylalanine carboxypeptidase domain-containing protein [Candidatus Woesearchaeota archaeon]
MALTYAEIDKKLHNISKHLAKLPCLPVNLDQEREKFFKSSTYNPIFTYEPEHEPLDKIEQALRNIEIDSSGIGIIFKKKRNELFNIVQMLKSIGTRKFTEISKILYGQPDDKLIKSAWKLINLHDSPDTTFISTSQVLVKLEYAIMKYGFNWKVKEKEMASKACVSCSNKTLYIKQDSFYTNKFVKRLIVHEIGTHILRNENGLQQPYKIFADGTTNYLATEEGLAVLNEELHNCLTKSTLKTYAARVIAVHKALKCTFRETYNYIVPYVGKHNAFDITLRAKRGIGNTFFPGAFTKDYLYLKGYRDLKQYLNHGGNIQRLYYGKIGLDDLDIVEKIPNIINPLFLENMKYYSDIIKYK